MRTTPSDRRTIAAITGFMLLLYLATANRWIGMVDSPEFASLFALGGVAHAPGYPLVVLAYHAFAWLPLPATWAASLVTGVFGALAIGVLFIACRCWGCSREESAVAALLVGVSSQVWVNHTFPEAFAVSNLLCAAILAVASPGMPFRPIRRAGLLGLLAGLSLGAHHTLVLLAPVGLYAVGRAASERREAGGSRTAAWLGAAGGCALGLTTYIYPLLTRSHVGLGGADNLSELLALFLREGYGTGKLSATGEHRPLEQLLFFAFESANDLVFVGAFVIAAGIAVAVGARHTQPWWRLIVACWVLAGPVFALLMNVSPEGPTFELVRKFHALAMIVATPIIGAGIAAVRARVPRAQDVRWWWALVAIVAMAGYVRIHRVHTPHLEDYLRNTFAHLPPSAIWFADGDHRTFGSEYLQEVEHVRPDVLFVNPNVFGNEQIVQRLRDRSGLALPSPVDQSDGTSRLDLKALVDVALDSGRPVFVTQDLRGLAPHVFGEFRLVPDGVAWRILPGDEDEPAASVLVARSKLAADQFVNRAAPPVYVDNPWAWSVFRTWTLLWTDLAERCERESDPCVETAHEMLERFPDL